MSDTPGGPNGRTTVPPPPPPPPGPKGGRTLYLVVAVVVALAAGGGALFVLSSSDDDDGPITAPGEVFLQRALDAGPDPFFSESDDLVSGGEIVFASTGGPATTAAPDEPVETVTVLGGEVGLYGGTRDGSRCDAAQMIAFLESEPEKAAAWASVQDIRVEDVSTYLSLLTPAVLLADTRVTNHGFRDGVATGFQATLQKGTAVLVDALGVPRARCSCGNPLAEPIPQINVVTFTGQSWPDFAPEEVQVVQPNPEPVDEFVMQDVEGGQPFVRERGTNGEVDVDAPPELAAQVDPVQILESGSEVAAPDGGPDDEPPDDEVTNGSPPGSGADYCQLASLLTSSEVAESEALELYEAAGIDIDILLNADEEDDTAFVRFLDQFFDALAAAGPDEIRADLELVADYWDPATIDIDELFNFFGDSEDTTPASVTAASDRVTAYNASVCGVE